MILLCRPKCLLFEAKRQNIVYDVLVSKFFLVLIERWNVAKSMHGSVTFAVAVAVAIAVAVVYMLLQC